MTESRTGAAEPAYVGDLGNGQQIYLQNQSNQTLITLSSHAPGQQQSQTSSLSTGTWSAPPTLFRTIAGYVLRIETVPGQTWIQLQANQLEVLAAVPLLMEAEVVSLQPVAESSNSLPPMQPMQMGKMQIQMNPMRMQMGDMTMKMGQPLKMGEAPSSPAAPAFCPQCGQAVASGDRFCSQCGHRLNSAV